ncbi:MAG: hypothetical protein NTX48_01405 [Planctomycetales bacterium]|nr:hypothetical protein [Planctomycetales bacterium]
MRLYHYICFNTSPEQVTKLKRVGVSIKAKNSAAFSLYDDDSRWPEVQCLLKSWNVKWRDHFEYSDEDQSASAYLHIIGAPEAAIPQPEKKSGWEAATYDLSKYCGTCGSYKLQVHPFQLIEAPKFGTDDVVSLYWVYDEFFVRTEIWKRVFKPFGIESLPVLCHKTQLPLETVVQLKIDDISPFPLDSNDKWESSVCSACGQKKNFGTRRTPYFPHFVGNPEGHLFKTQELFGAGLISARAIVCSNELYQAVLSAGVRGFQFEPQEMD